jgi:hypothetical protein
MNEEELRKKWMEFYDEEVFSYKVPPDRGYHIPSLGVSIENKGDETIMVFVVTEQEKDFEKV